MTPAERGWLMRLFRRLLEQEEPGSLSARQRAEIRWSGQPPASTFLVLTDEGFIDLDDRE